MRTTETALREVLAERASEGELYEKMPADWVSCTACGHRCRIPPGKPGVCKVRFNRDGKLFVPRGYVSTLQVDPIEKKPFHHVLPGAQVLSFGMLGCDYHCSFCQNWLTSQSLRDPAAGIRPSDIPAEEIITCATTQRTEVIASTYNEPLITSEWAVEVFKMARPCGLRCAYVSNGNATLEALEYMRPWVDCCNIDLKSFRDRRYRELGGVLDRVLATIQQAHEMGFWIEVVTLIVPGFNDSYEELRDIADFVAGVSRDIPWHVTAFHPDYRMQDADRTQTEQLMNAARIGKESGLNFVYAGNLPGRVGDLENTLCQDCGVRLIQRIGYRIIENRIERGKCPDCSHPVPGIWS